jgi:hypothetical protein
LTRKARRKADALVVVSSSVNVYLSEVVADALRGEATRCLCRVRDVADDFFGAYWPQYMADRFFEDLGADEKHDVPKCSADTTTAPDGDPRPSRPLPSPVSEVTPNLPQGDPPRKVGPWPPG